MPVTVLIPLIVACMNAAPIVVKDILAVFEEIKASKAKTVTPAHVAKINAAVAGTSLPTIDASEWDENHSGD